MFLDLTPANALSLDLFDPSERTTASPRMAVLDQINAVMGPGTLRLAREGFQHLWASRQARRSPAYTTCWRQLLWVQ